MEATYFSVAWSGPDTFGIGVRQYLGLSTTDSSQVVLTLLSCPSPRSGETSSLRELWCGHAAAEEMPPQPSREHLGVS